MISLLLALAARLTPQDAPAPRNPILDGVGIQAGEGLVSLSELERVIKRYQEKEPPRSREEDERQRAEVRRVLGTQRLEQQKGADLGLDPLQISRISRANLEAERDKEGLEAYLAQLRLQGKDALAEEADRKQQILSFMWREAALGKAFAAKRATRDPHIRPGELRDIYEENKANLAPPTAQFCWLIVTSASAGGADEARASCEDARQRVLSGEDLALLVEERGAELRDTRGLTPFIPPKAFWDPALRPFAETAEVDELSAVLPLTNPKTGNPDPGLGFQLAELRERNTPPVPEFESPDVQRILRDVFTNRRRELILERAREALRREAYTWVNPLIAGPRPAPGPVQP